MGKIKIITWVLVVLLVHCVTISVIAIPAPAAEEPIYYNNEQNPDGSYFFSYETPDGIFREEKGTLVKKLKTSSSNEDDTYLKVEGSYAYRGPDGKIYKTTYIADESGYRTNQKSSDSVLTKTNKEDRFGIYVSSAALASLAGGGLG